MSYRYWSNEDCQYLEKYWGTMATTKIAKALNRSAFSVKKKAYHMGLGRKRIYNGLISARELYACLHNGRLPYRNNRESFLRKGMPFRKYYLSEKFPERAIWMIDIDNFWKWFGQHRDAFDPTKIEKNILGEEPEWFKQKRREAWAKIRAERWKEFGGLQ